MFKLKRILFLAGLSVFTGSCVFVGDVFAADEWPRFRGPQANGHAESADLPVNWSETENVAWKTAIPGHGHSSPVISGDQIWLTTAVESELTEEEQKVRLASLKNFKGEVINPRGLEIAGKISLRAICVSRKSGEIVRDVEVFAVPAPEPIHSLNSYASPTPILEDGRVYCHFGTYGTAAVDGSTGEIIWKNTEHHVDHQNGPGSSPAIWQNHLVINFDGIDTQYVAAIDKRDGRTVWRTKRSGEMDAKAEFRKAYGTSAIIESESGPQVISPGANWLYSYHAASGEELWRAPYGTLGFSTVPLPVYGDGLVFVSTSFIRPRLLAVRYDGPDSGNDSRVVWQIDGQLPQKPSMLLVGDELYFVTDKGIGMCLNARTGDEKWKARVGGQFSASPLFAGGKMYFFSHEGKTVVVEPGEEYQQVAENMLDGGVMASPAVAGNALFLRTDSHLYRIQKK